MNQIAFISGQTFLYWSPILLAIGAGVGIFTFLALYLAKSRNLPAAAVAVPLGLIASLVLARIFHWYCRTDIYESFSAAITDLSRGGFALMGVFAGCILTAILLRLLRVSKNLPQMLDCMALAAGAGIPVGRLAAFFDPSDRGMVLGADVGLPAAWPVVNPVSGQTENRLATFLLQAGVTAVIFLILLVFYLRRKRRDGDTALLFLTAYAAAQVVLDSTRYDALYLRSNGFVSVVQIISALILVTAAVVFSVRMVRKNGFRKRFFAYWGGLLLLIAGAGFMEYYVQRHGSQWPFAYSVMSLCLLLAVGVIVLLWRKGCREPASGEKT